MFFRCSCLPLASDSNSSPHYTSWWSSLLYCTSQDWPSSLPPLLLAVATCSISDGTLSSWHFTWPPIALRWTWSCASSLGSHPRRSSVYTVRTLRVRVRLLWHQLHLLSEPRDLCRRDTHCRQRPRVIADTSKYLTLKQLFAVWDQRRKSVPPHPIHSECHLQLGGIRGDF